MFDELDSNERRGEQPAPSRMGDAAVPRPVSDREVPLAKQPLSATINAWLDGELPESAVRHADSARDVDFWLRLEREVEVRREMKTPVHVYGEIMKALPVAAPHAVRWWRREIRLTPILAVGVAVGALLAGAAITALVLLGR